MAKKKSKSFNKHVYALVAIIVLLVAAGIASYGAGSTPPPTGAATHETVYTKTIIGLNSFWIFVNNSLVANEGIKSFGNGGTPSIESIATGIANGIKANSTAGSAVYGYSGSAGVEGKNANGNYGKLGTAQQGVYGYTSYGGSSSIGVKGEAPFGYGVEAVSTNGRGVSATSTNGDAVYGESTTSIGVRGLTNSVSSYAGYFSGGKGLYASRISFGIDAFNKDTDEGILILGTRGGYTTSCFNVCLKHGLTCFASYQYDNAAWINCGTTSAVQRYCWCD